MHQPPSADLPDRLHAQHPDSPAPPSQAGYGVVNFRCRSPPNLVNIDWFGCGQVVSGAGFLLNNTMDDFSSKPGSPNIFGVVGGDANAIAADKRPLSTMTPTILTLHGRVAVVIGTPGGSRMPTSIFQVLTNWHDFHMPLEAAVAAPRIHHQLLPPDTLFEEPYATLDPMVRASLTARGYRFVTLAFNGDIQVIVAGASGVEAVADPRGRGVARVLPPGRVRRAAGPVPALVRQP